LQVLSNRCEICIDVQNGLGKYRLLYEYVEIRRLDQILAIKDEILVGVMEDIRSKCRNKSA